MGTCRGCGGILGRDCYNEHDCISISNNKEQYFAQGFQDAENYIGILIYTLNQNKIPIPNSFSAEPPLILKIESGCDNEYIDDGLPW